MVFARTWDPTTPDGSTTQASDIDLWMRYIKVDVEERMLQEHSWARDANDGRHLPGKCGVLLHDTAANIDTAFAARTEPGLAFSSDTKNLYYNNAGSKAALDIDHGSLSGLADADHAAYLPLAGGTMAAAIAMDSNKVTGLADGTASGDALHVGQADDASLEVAAGVLQVKDLGITTAKLAAGAVEQHDSAIGTSDITESTHAYVDMTDMEVTLTTTGGPVLITASMCIALGADGHRCALRIARDGEVRQTWSIVGAGASTYDSPVTLTILDLPSAGTYTWKVQWAGIGAATAYQHGASYPRRMHAQEFKK